MSIQWSDFLIGGLSGVGATIFSNPIDTVKVRMQLQGELRDRAHHLKERHFRNLPHAIYVIAKNEGVTALQKGLVPALYYSFVMNGVRLGLYKTAEHNYLFHDHKGDVDSIKSFAWSVFVGALSGVLTNPLVVVKTRLQSSAKSHLASGTQHHYAGTIEAIRKILAQEGVQGFFTGTVGTFWRIAAGSGVQLTTFLEAKQMLIKHEMFANSPFWLAFTASALSGVTMALFVTPLDTVVIRLYNQGKPEPGKPPKYSGLLDCIYKTYKIEGFHGLYKGIGPFYFRIAPHTSLSLIFWDLFNHFYDK